MSDSKDSRSYMMPDDRLYAGFGKVDITPDYPVGLGGYGNSAARMVEAVVEQVYATCIALTEGDETILVFTVDACAFSQDTQNSMRTVLSEALNLPGEKMFFAATHCHSIPGVSGYPNAQRYATDLRAWMLKAAQVALLDRAPATISVGKKIIHGMNFVRHYLMEDGTYTGPNFGRWKDNTPVAYAGTPDNGLGLVQFHRELPKKNILLVNWQGHPDCARQIGFNNMAPSYVGPLRDTLSVNTGCLVAYFTGADGNMNIGSRIEKDKNHLNWREYGVKMATLIYEAYKEMEPLEGKGIATTSRVFQAVVDHSLDDQLEIAQKVYQMFFDEGLAVANAEALKHNMTSCYQARAIIYRAKRGATQPMELFAFRVGNVGFTSSDYEMFSEAGLYIKENSPTAMTMILTGNHGYLPSDPAFNYRSYEADTGLFIRGTSERLAETMVDMLKEIEIKE